MTSSPTFSVHTETSPAGPVVVVAGEADTGASNALDDSLRSAMLSAVGGGANRAIVIDLSATTLLDSRTIGVLASWVEQLGGKGWHVPIVCSDPNLLRLFRLIGLEQTFDFAATRDEAIATGAD